MQKKISLSLLGLLITVMMIMGAFVTGALAMDNHSSNGANSVNQSNTHINNNGANMGQSASNTGNNMSNMNGMNMGSMNSSSGNGTNSDEVNAPPNWSFIYIIGAINVIAIIAAALMKKSALKENGVN